MSSVGGASANTCGDDFVVASSNPLGAWSIRLILLSTCRSFRPCFVRASYWPLFNKIWIERNVKIEMIAHLH